jgi:hypothetical protein
MDDEHCPDSAYPVSHPPTRPVTRSFARQENIPIQPLFKDSRKIQPSKPAQPQNVKVQPPNIEAPIATPQRTPSPKSGKPAQRTIPDRPVLQPTVIRQPQPRLVDEVLEKRNQIQEQTKPMSS